MKFLRSPRGRRLLLGGSLAVTALLSVIRLVERDPVPWEWVAAFAIGTALLAGPVAWVVRDRIPEERREHLGYVAAGVALLCAPVALGLGLVFGNLLIVLDAAAFGGIVGLAVALLAERTLVPERLRGSA